MTARAGVWLLVAALFSPACLGAVQVAPTPVVPFDTAGYYEALAGRFAPVLRFAPGEQYFPTVPFFTAFESSDAGGRLSLDLTDLDRIAPIGNGVGQDGERASWTVLDSLYRQRVADDSIPVPAVFYRVRPLSSRQRDQMWDFLKKDEQAWEREKVDEWFSNEDQHSVDFVAIEYYFYYLNDNGLEGHPQDIEFVFVFVPFNGDRDRIRITVGAGHTPRTPNNVLVQSRDSVRADVIVELGGHASAPDLDPYGQFQIGIDVNWHASDVWGTRDLLALTGTGFVGAYRPEMTLSRADGKVLCPAEQTSGMETRKVRELLPDDCDQAYRLLPVETFRDINALLNQQNGAEGFLGLFGGSYSTVQEDPDAVLRALRADFDVVASDLPVPDVVRRLTAWTRGLCCTEVGQSNDVAARRHQIWEHEHFHKDPVAIMKPHLYRPSTVAFEKGEFSSWWDLLVWGATFHPAQGAGFNDGAYELHGGFVVPAPTWLPTRLPGFLELHAGAVLGTRSALTVAAVYDNEYRDFIGWFTRLAYTDRRAEVTGEEGDADVTISAGLSLLIWSWDDPWGPGELFPVNALRLRVGPRLGLHAWDEVFHDTDWEFQVSLNR